MTAVHTKDFRGMVPRVSPRLLAPNYAVSALNCKLSSGRLDPIRGPALVHTSSAEVVTMYRYRFGAEQNWLVFPHVVDVAASPTAQDSRGRLYFTGANGGEPKMTTFADAISGAGPYPTAFYVLGVYIPLLAAALAVVGGSGTVESRSYVHTFRTQFQEESAPSPETVVSGFINGSWNLSGMEAPPPNTGTVTAATTISPGVVEVTLNTARGLAQHEQVSFTGVLGMSALNATFNLLAVDLATNKVQVALTTAQTFTAGGAWARVAPHNLANMTRRIWRSIGTNADWRLVAEIPASTTSYNDTVASTVVALNSSLATRDSYTPPKNGHSLVALANGAHAMLAGNELCISEKNKPYSYPIANRYAFAGAGVALAVAGNSIIILTDGYPIVATATAPEAANLATLPKYAPCVSKRGTVNVGAGALFPSHDGLYLATAGDAANATEALFDFDTWQAMNPASFVAAYHDQHYYAMRVATGEGQTDKIMVLDTRKPDSISEIDERAGALYANPLDGKLYAGIAKTIKQWDADDTNRYPIAWRSRDNQLGPPVNFSCAQVHAAYEQIVPINTAIQDANALLLADADNILGAIGITELAMLPLAGTNLLAANTQTANRLQFALVIDGEVVHSEELTSSDPIRLPGGFLSELAAIEINSSIPVYSVTIAQGMEELRQVST